jgi:broad specificity phosphatase PhoE
MSVIGPKWAFTPPAAESNATMSVRVREWYHSLAQNTVAVAHGGTLSGLIVQLGIHSAEEAPHLDIAQGVVYAISNGMLSRYA